MPPERIPFPPDPEKSAYRLFSPQLESDERVYFHGTNAANLEPILNQGFRIPSSLPSVSFCDQSSLALRYACEKRTTDQPEGCVLAVRYENLSAPNLDVGVSVLHDYTCTPQPLVIAYCIVPANYIYR
jgi:hypothetical protein